MSFDVRSKADSGERRYRELLAVGLQPVPVHFRRNRLARRYILRVNAEGVIHVTIPRGGTESGAREFARKHTRWIELQIQRHLNRPSSPAPWTHGTEIFFRGESIKLSVEPTITGKRIDFANQTIDTSARHSDVRECVQNKLRALANVELPTRTLELAQREGLKVHRVTVRNQRTRWGSCSSRATISLNWRLIQTPAFVRDYIILHELMHLREMNHSERYWALVQKACPDYLQAEAWLKSHSKLLH